MTGFTTALSKYAQFSGRSRRSEFWGFHAVLIGIGVVLGVIYGISAAMVETSGEGNPLAMIVVALGAVIGLAIFVPSLALGWRRCQDIGAPGAVAIIGLFVPLVMWIVGIIPGTQGPNPYGEDPKG